MAATSGACFMSPRPSPKVHDCRAQNSSAVHALASISSPNQTRGQVSNPYASPTARRTARTCSALPFGFPAFGFPAFGFPAGGEQTGKPSSANGWIRTAGSNGANGGCNSAAEGVEGATSGGGASAAAAPVVHTSPSQLGGLMAQLGARRRLNLSLAAQAQATTTGAHVAAATPLASEVEGSQQEDDAGRGNVGSRRRRPLPYPWTVAGADSEAGAEWHVGSGVMYGHRGAELHLGQLPQLLVDASGNGEDGAAPEPLSRLPFQSEWQQQHGQPRHHDLDRRRRDLLDQLHSGLAGGRLRPGELLGVPGLLQFLVSTMGVGPEAPGSEHWQVSERGVTAATGVALECLCTLLSEDALPPHAVEELLPAVRATLEVLRAARLPSAVTAPSHGSPPPGSPLAPAWLQGAGYSDSTAQAYGWSTDVSAAFFAASVLVRAARYPALADAVVAGGGLELMVQLMGSRPPMLAQMAIFATYKLVRQPGGPQGPQSPGRGVAGGAAASTAAAPRSAAADGEEQQQQEGQRRRDAALLAVAQAGGMGTLCGCLEDLEDRPSRDMASSLMLDMALGPQVPAVVARLNHVQPLVAVMASRRYDNIARMYALLVLARLCNHSPECQMDAVREGAVEPLLSLVRRGCDEEQTHACRLLAILAQAVPTHGRFKELGVMQCVMPLLRGTRGAVVAEHASSVLAVLTQNPDMHFHIVGCGAVPAMVPLLSGGTEKARTYALASLMLLCEQEERHAAVVVRAGALPALVGMAAQRGPVAAGGAAAAASPARSVGKAASAAAATAPQRGIATVQEFAAAVLCSLSRYVDVQAELVASGALPALVRCLGDGAPEAAVHAAEALVHVAAGDAEAKRIIAGDAAAATAMLRLLSHDKPAARYWALQLLRALSTDDAALRLAAGLPQDLPPDEHGLLSPGGPVATGAAEPPPHAETRAPELVGALIRLLRWSDGHASWQQGRCRVLAAWLLARMCGLQPFAPLVLASGAVRELLSMLAEEQQRLAAGTAGPSVGSGYQAQPEGSDLTVPLLPGEADIEGDGWMTGGRGGRDSSALGTAGEADIYALGSGPTGGGSGGGSHPRRTRFDVNATAAATAALLSVARLGREGRMAVLAELALLQWLGTAVRLDGLEKA